MTGAIDYRHISILWASPEDAAELALLHAGLFAKPWDADSFLRLLVHPGSTSFLARVGAPAQTAGFIVSQLAADEAEILSIAVASDFRGAGLARRLLDVHLRRLAGYGVATVFLEVDEHNTPARRLYAGFDFAKVGRRESYYAAAAAALVLRRHLS